MWSHLNSFPIASLLARQQSIPDHLKLTIDEIKRQNHPHSYFVYNSKPDEQLELDQPFIYFSSWVHVLAKAMGDSDL